jgi:dephospho-CoA kinase
MKIIGITGKIGAGKTFITNHISKNYDAPIFNCDMYAKSIRTTDPHIINGLKTIFGDKLYIEGTTVYDSMHMAEIMFTHEEILNRVNDLYRGAIYQGICRFIYDFKYGIDPPKFVLIESASLVTSGLLKLIDSIILVDADVHIREERVLTRGVDLTYFHSINAAQGSVNKQVDFLRDNNIKFQKLLNDGIVTLPELYKTIENIFNIILL